MKNIVRIIVAVGFTLVIGQSLESAKSNPNKPRKSDKQVLTKGHVKDKKTLKQTIEELKNESVKEQDPKKKAKLDKRIKALEDKSQVINKKYEDRKKKREEDGKARKSQPGTKSSGHKKQQPGTKSSGHKKQQPGTKSSGHKK